MAEAPMTLADFLTRSRVLQADYARISAITGTAPRTLTQWAKDTALLLSDPATRWDPNYLPGTVSAASDVPLPFPLASVEQGVAIVAKLAQVDPTLALTRMESGVQVIKPAALPGYASATAGQVISRGISGEIAWQSPASVNLAVTTLPNGYLSVTTGSGGGSIDTAAVLSIVQQQTLSLASVPDTVVIGGVTVIGKVYQPTAPASYTPSITSIAQAAVAGSVASAITSTGLSAQVNADSGSAGTLANEAALTGVAAGTYHIGSVYVTWSGSAVTQRSPVLATQVGLDAATASGATLKGSVGNTLAGLATKGQADGRQLADGSQWDWAASATADYANVTAASVSGVWVRNRPLRVWDVSKYAAYVAGPLGGDWAQGLTYINSLMADGDTLLMPPGVYTTTTRAIIATPITFSCAGATLDVNHAGIGLDLLPGGLHENGAARRTAGFGPQGIENTYRGVLPKIVKRFAARAFDGGMGLRVSNTYYGQIDITQGIQGFDAGMRLDSANAAADSTGFGGLSYCVFRLGRMENNNNILIQFTSGAGQYITQNMFMGGSLTNQTFSATYTGSNHIYIDGGPAQGMCNNLTFVGTSLEGKQASGVNVTGMAEQIYLIKGRMEFGAGIVNAVSLAAQTASCDIEAYFLADHLANGKVSEQGKNNRLRDCGKLAGDLNYVNGLSIVAGKDAAYSAAQNWLPAALDAEPVFAVSYAPGGAGVVIDLRKTRAVRITVTAAGAIGASVISFTNPPYVGYRVKVSIQQFSTAATSISAAFMTPINYGPQVPPVPRASGIDNFILYADGYAMPTYIEAHTFN